MRKPVSRRWFLKWLAASAAGIVLASCRRQDVVTGVQETRLSSSTRIILDATPQPTSVSPVELTPAEIVDATATASPPWNPIAQVAAGQVTEYDHSLVKNELEQMLDALGGVEGMVPYGGVVVIKVNLTGGVHTHHMGGIPAVESIATHPLVVRALGELMIDAGAGELWIVEAVYEVESYQDWGYEDIAQALNAHLIDLNNPDPYPSFIQVSVPGGLIYEQFHFHPILEECDTFVSVGKMKCHIECGVTHSMKNLVGLVPYQLYRLDESHRWRSAFHGSAEELPQRLPRVVVDLNLARPVHLSIIDGIKTVEAGEGSWAAGVNQVTPGVLLAGKNSVSTDAIATAVQGFDPTGEHPEAPFSRAVNHLNLANALGMGSNRLEEIEVLGPSVSELMISFKPATGYR
jgi:uncharacterized protein (DUF362 family)